MPSNLLDWMRPFVVQELPCLGSTVHFMRNRRFDEDSDDWRDVVAGVEGEAQVCKAVRHLTNFVARLDRLIAGGLPKQEAYILFGNFVNGAVTHLQRALSCDPPKWRAFDDQVVAVVGRWLGGALSDTSRKVLFLQAKLGGGGLASAELRTDAAFLGSWNTVKNPVFRAQGVETNEQSALLAPKLHAAIQAARQRIISSGGSLSVPTQKLITKSLRNRKHKQLLEQLSLEDLDGKCLLDSQMLEGAAWLRCPKDAGTSMSNDEFCVCLRRRLLYVDPAAQGATPCVLRAARSSNVCGHIGPGKYGRHPVCCDKGPGFHHRHDGCRDDLAKWCSDTFRTEANTEQHIPRWDRHGPRGLERAVLDVVLLDNPAAPGPLNIDISIIEATSPDPDEARSRARKPGLAALQREREKHRRYPGDFLLPAVLESGGRWGNEFRRWAKAALPPDANRGPRLAELRQRLAVSLQRGIAAALLSSSSGCKRPWA